MQISKNGLSTRMSERLRPCKLPEVQESLAGVCQLRHTLVPDLLQVRTPPNQTRCQPPVREMDASGYHSSEEEISDVS